MSTGTHSLDQIVANAFRSHSRTLKEVFDTYAILDQAIPPSIRYRLDDNLNARQHLLRDEVQDNNALSEVNTAIMNYINLGNSYMAGVCFREAWDCVDAYEQRTSGAEVHRGSIAFNYALSRLQAWDFICAMHYFELAEQETRKTRHDDKFCIYEFDLFRSNFWDSMHVDVNQNPIPLYNEFWKTSYDKNSAYDDYLNLSSSSKLPYVMHTARRIRLRNLEAQSHWNGSTSLRLEYWMLASDLARTLEVEAGVIFKHATATPASMTLIPRLEQGFTNTKYGNLSHIMNSQIYPKYPRQDPTVSSAALFELAFDGILAEIRNASNSIQLRLAYALYLLGFARNQVAHKIDEKSKLFTQLDDTKFIVDVFISLCRTDEWKGL